MLRHIVMPWRHSVTLWHNHICKYRINDIFELVNPKYYRNKERTISLARLQAEMDTAWLMTSWRHFVTSYHHANTMTITTLSLATKEITETKWNQLSSTFAGWDESSSFVTSCNNFSDVMTSRYDMKTSCKYIHDISVEPSNRNNYRNTCVSPI